MFSIVVSGDGTAWETDQLMRMPKGRFKEYSDSESQAISADRPETLGLLEKTPALLMYEIGTNGPTIDFVKYGYLKDVRVSDYDIAFRFSEEGTFPRSVIYEFASRLGLARFENSRTHWAIKDGNLPSALLDRLQQSVEQRANLINADASKDSGSWTVFISYSWDNEAHKEWVLGFATRLRSHGIDTILDQTHLQFGGRTPEFMERSVRDSRSVLVICTEGYKQRFDDRIGGVGYEGHIITAEILAATGPKFIPVLRQGSWNASMPTALAGVFGVDLREDAEEPYQELVRHLHGVTPLGPIGPPPDWIHAKFPVSTALP